MRYTWNTVPVCTIGARRGAWRHYLISAILLLNGRFVDAVMAVIKLRLRSAFLRFAFYFAKIVTRFLFIMEISMRTENYTRNEYEQKLFSIIGLWVVTKKGHLLADIY